MSNNRNNRNNQNNITMNLQMRLDIIGIIGWDVTLEEINGAIDTVEQNDEIDSLLVRISSFGGDVSTALAIYDRLRALAGDGVAVTTHMAGLCASAATVIAMAGDKRTMNPYGLMLVHRASVMTAGNRHEHEQSLDTLDKIDERLAALYADRTGMSQGDALELMDKAGGEGIFIDAAQAYNYGFLTEEPETRDVDGVENLATRILGSFDDNARLAAALVTAQERLEEEKAGREADRGAASKVAELNQSEIKRLNGSIDALKRDILKLEAEKQTLAAELDKRPVACDRIDGDDPAAAWQNSERYRRVKHLLQTT